MPYPRRQGRFPSPPGCREDRWGAHNTCGTFHDGFGLLKLVNRWRIPEVLWAVTHEPVKAHDGVYAQRRVRILSVRPRFLNRESVIEAINRA
jgi:hypothetical protein